MAGRIRRLDLLSRSFYTICKKKGRILEETRSRRLLRSIPMTLSTASRRWLHQPSRTNRLSLGAVTTLSINTKFCKLYTATRNPALLLPQHRQDLLPEPRLGSRPANCHSLRPYFSDRDFLSVIAAVTTPRTTPPANPVSRKTHSSVAVWRNLPSVPGMAKT